MTGDLSGCTLSDLSCIIVGCHCSLNGDDVTKRNLCCKSENVKLITVCINDSYAHISVIFIPCIYRANRTGYFNIPAILRLKSLGNGNCEVVIGVYSITGRTVAVSIGMSGCGNSFLSGDNFTTYRTLNAFGKTGSGTSGSYCENSFLSVTESVNCNIISGKLYITY